MKDNDFDRDYNFSRLYDEKLHKIVIQELKTKVITKSTLEQDKVGIDFWHDNFKVEYKVYHKDYDNVCLELFSNMYDKPGWTLDYKKKTDYICFYWIDTERYLFLDYKKLRKLCRENYVEWRVRHKRIINNEGRAECVIVPTEILEICK